MFEKDFYYEVEKPNALKYILYGDTDSIFIAIPDPKIKEKTAEQKWETAEKSAGEINKLIIDYTKEKILKRCNINPEHNRTFFDTELLMESIMFLDIKKNYAYNLLVKEGKVLDPPKTNYKGIPVIKSDAAKMTQQLLREMIENVILNNKIEDKDKMKSILEIVNKYHQKFQKDVSKYNFSDIGVPAKWSKDELSINGMKIYNKILNEDVFTFGSAGKFIYTKFQSLNEFKDLGINTKNINGICVPYEYNPEKLKEKLNQYGITIDGHRQWNDKIFIKICQRVADLAKTISRSS
ncbi:MAG: DNA polymerase domain-containing protein [Candidatus Woesearchaeota archaeon]